MLWNGIKIKILKDMFEREKSVYKRVYILAMIKKLENKMKRGI